MMSCRPRDENWPCWPSISMTVASSLYACDAVYILVFIRLTVAWVSEIPEPIGVNV